MNRPIPTKSKHVLATIHEGKLYVDVPRDWKKRAGKRGKSHQRRGLATRSPIKATGVFRPGEKDQLRAFCAKHKIRTFQASSTLDFPDDEGWKIEHGAAAIWPTGHVNSLRAFVAYGLSWDEKSTPENHYKGVIFDVDGALIWKCEHQHSTVDAAESCAELEQSGRRFMSDIHALVDNEFSTGPALEPELLMRAKVALADALLCAWGDELHEQLTHWRNNVACDCGGCKAFQELIGYVEKIDAGDETKDSRTWAHAVRRTAQET